MIMISKADLGLNLMYSFSWCQTTKAVNDVQLDLTSELKRNEM